MSSRRPTKTVAQLSYEILKPKVGDYVMVIANFGYDYAPNYDYDSDDTRDSVLDWENVWCESMCDSLGQILRIISLDKNNYNIKLEDNYEYPAFALKPAKSPNQTVVLNDEYTAVINKEDETIEVGCQSFSIEKLQALVDATRNSGFDIE